MPFSFDVVVGAFCRRACRSLRPASRLGPNPWRPSFLPAKRAKQQIRSLAWSIQGRHHRPRERPECERTAATPRLCRVDHCPWPQTRQANEIDFVSPIPKSLTLWAAGFNTSLNDSFCLLLKPFTEPRCVCLPCLGPPRVSLVGTGSCPPTSHLHLFITSSARATSRLPHIVFWKKLCCQARCRGKRIVTISAIVSNTVAVISFLSGPTLRV